MFSCTTVDSIWLSGFEGMETIPDEASRVQPSFATYAASSSPVMPINYVAFQTLKEINVTCQMQVGTQSVTSYPPECSLHSLHNDASHSVLEADTLNGIVIAQRFGTFGVIQLPKSWESALLEEVVEFGDDRKEGG